MAQRPSFDRPTVSIVSPLRYAGGKRRFSYFISECLRLSGIHPKVVIEPFAGGASVTLQLLADDVVDSAVIGDADPLVAAFWSTVFYDSKWLVEAIHEVDISLKTWDHFKHNHFRGRRDRALACLFLNRTSFSGILANSAGPIGGRSQRSAYSLGCRFPRAVLAKRVDAAAKLAPKVLAVHCGDWKDTVTLGAKHVPQRSSRFIYLDPPFYKNAERLYRHFFRNDEHAAFRDHVLALKEWWFMSYDAAPAIRDLYTSNGHTPRNVEVLYSTASNAQQTPTKEFVFSNLPRHPQSTRLWRQAHLW